MNRCFAMESMFNDDPFFSQESLLSAASGLQRGFFHGRSQLAHGLLAELCDGLPGDLLLRERPRLASDFLGLTPEAPTRRRSEGPPSSSSSSAATEPARAPTDLSVSLDARGFGPEDITVKLEGRTLAVAAVRRAGAEETRSRSSASSSSSSRSAASRQSGFAQRIDLPAHLDLAALTCNLTEDGHLRIHAPAAPQPTGEEHQVPVRFRTSLDIPITKETSAGKTTPTA